MPTNPTPDALSAEMRLAGVYIASKAHHGPRWRDLRAAGWPIVSTWIDEAEKGATNDWGDLWMRCLREAAAASTTILYREEGEELKGARLEVGAALAAGHSVIVVGPVEDSWMRHPLVHGAPSLAAALWMAVPELAHTLPVPDVAALARRDEPVTADAAEVSRLISTAGEALGLFPFVIKCGEAWSATCQETLNRARVALTELGRRALARPSTPALEPYQSRVKPWLDACFGPKIAGDKVERNHRFLEEALELVQSTGCTRDEAHQLVDYVFGRPAGDTHQEVGGVMNTLAALCLAHGLDMHEEGERELARVWTKVEQIRAKQAGKPKHGPLPGPSEPDVLARRDEPVGAVTDLEWCRTNLNGEAACPCCHGTMRVGHKYGCDIAKAIASAPDVAHQVFALYDQQRQQMVHIIVENGVGREMTPAEAALFEGDDESPAALARPSTPARPAVSAVLDAVREWTLDRTPSGLAEKRLYVAFADLFPEEFAGKENCRCDDRDGCDECPPKSVIDAALDTLRAEIALASRAEPADGQRGEGSGS